MLQGTLPMPLLDYTTRVSVDKTVGEIQKYLPSHAAKAILCEHDDKGYVIALSFNQYVQTTRSKGWSRPGRRRRRL
jgi:hypothetical protein